MFEINDTVDEARTILRAARDQLQQRLAERVVECSEEILSDARGESYLSEVETLHDQLGLKLLQVSQMLECMSAPVGDSVGAGVEEFDDVAAPAVPGPAAFEEFVQQVEAGEIELAGITLATVLSLTIARARECAVYFRDQMAADPQFLDSAMQLRVAIENQSTNDCLECLRFSFGLQGPERIRAFESLRQHTIR